MSVLKEVINDKNKIIIEDIQRIAQLEQENGELWKVIQDIHNYLLEGVKPWDIGHHHVYVMVDDMLRKKGKPKE